ncbi:DUF3278 domain-containing protein [Streptococcus halotolerans]|uniref:DUF3278 domain-containing protein n=1 Tax=Streptococcus halotolerans TaxID=1814128 RepID=UPI0007886F80|nr:DUF3278 domain-containing protein [Streptococcus halotolerans]
MSKKTNRLEKQFARFFGISGVFDEYVQQIAYRLAGHAYLILTYYILLSSLIFLTINDFLPNCSGLIYVGINILVTVFIIPLTLKMKTDKADIDTSGMIEVPKENIDKERRKAIKRGILSGILFTGFMLIQNSLTALKNGKSLWDLVTQPGALIGTLIGGIIFAGFMTALAYYSISQEKD